MSAMPKYPFLTKDFSPRGGGIDFLGLRYVNLHMVGNYLIPELNNVTRDMGMFFLGAWVPWKFSQLTDERSFSSNNYRAFREKAEVAISLNMRDEAPAAQEFGNTRNRVGVTQNCRLPGQLSFKAASRKAQNSFYAAAIYGPSFVALGFIDDYFARAKDGFELKVAVVSPDPDTRTIVEAVDAALRDSDAYDKLASLRDESFTENEVDELGRNGLAPPCYRHQRFNALKPLFQKKLLPTDVNARGYARTRTTRLLLATLEQHDGQTSDEIRNAWYTGQFGDGAVLRLADEDLEDMRQYWSHFMARQYQRYAIELMLWCFETALVNGCRSIEETVDYWVKRSSNAGQPLPVTFRQMLDDVAGKLKKDNDEATSRAWNDAVHGGHESFEFVYEAHGDEGCLNALRMCAGWYWRMLSRENSGEYKHLMTLGDSDRMSMSWFIEWIQKRQEFPIRDFLKDVFSDLMFSQHMRIALSRFDGRAQRLRFVLGDNGIEATVSARGDLGNLRLPWMPDRLDTLIELLCDIDVLNQDENGVVRLGRRSKGVA